MAENNVSTTYIDAPVRFGTLAYNRTPILHEPVPAGTAFDTPPYLVEGTGGFDFRTKNQDPSSRLSRIALHAGQIGVSSYTLDREMLVHELETPMSVDDYLLAWGLYTSMVRSSGNIAKSVNENPGLVVNSNIRDDIKMLLLKGSSIAESLDEDSQATFVKRMAENFCTSSKDEEFGSRFNNAMREAKLALFDIVGNPDSVIDPEVTLATSLVQQIAKNGSSHAVNELYRPFVKDPTVLIRTPELLFMLDDILAAQRSVTRTDAHKLCGGIISAIFSEVLDDSNDCSAYAKSLAQAYFKIADSNFEAHSPYGTELRKPSEGNRQLMPAALIALAAAVSRSNPGDGIVFSGRANLEELPKAFDYILPQLEIGRLWPELDIDTVKTIERALSKVIGMAK